MITANQTKREADWLLQKMREYNFGGSILEIGSHAGGFLAWLAYNCKSGTKIRSVELSRDYGLEVVINKLKDDGFDAEVHFGDSRDPGSIYWAARHGPYDFVFIDGDHSPLGVQADWMNYGLMGRWVGFHDIKEDVVTMGTVKLWNELKVKYPSMEFSIRPDWNGIGLIQMPQFGETYIHSGADQIRFATD